jgi:uroporphyrinogen-III decarboxylase
MDFNKVTEDKLARIGEISPVILYLFYKEVNLKKERILKDSEIRNMENYIFVW